MKTNNSAVNDQGDHETHDSDGLDRDHPTGVDASGDDQHNERASSERDQPMTQISPHEILADALEREARVIATRLLRALAAARYEVRLIEHLPPEQETKPPPNPTQQISDGSGWLPKYGDW